MYCVFVHVHVCVYTCAWVCVCVCAHVYMHVYMSVYVETRVKVYALFPRHNPPCFLFFDYFILCVFMPTIFSPLN